MLLKFRLLYIIRVKGGIDMRVRKELNICIGERVRQARNAAGYTQEKLAEKLDVTIQYVSDLERGVVGTSIPTLVRICESLSVSSDFLLMGLDREVEPLDLSICLRKLSRRNGGSWNQA